LSTISLEAYDSLLIGEIEHRFGPYITQPKIVLSPDIYKRLGAWGQTTFIRDGYPVMIEIDRDIYQKNPALGKEVLCHELLEWRMIERGEKYPHYLAEKYTNEILARANITPIDVFLSRRPLLRLLLRGY